MGEDSVDDEQRIAADDGYGQLLGVCLVTVPALGTSDTGKAGSEVHWGRCRVLDRLAATDVRRPGLLELLERAGRRVLGTVGDARLVDVDHPARGGVRGAALHDGSGRVAIPGFYDEVRNWSEKERAYMARVGPSDEKILANAGVSRGWGEPGYTLYERTTTRPAVVLNGIVGGHYGPGVKGVIPTGAMAKLSFRLVPDQNPLHIDKLFRAHIARISPKPVHVAVHTTAPIQPAFIDRNHPAVLTAFHAYKKGFGAYPVFLRSGGSIPVVTTFQEHLGIPTVLMGFGLPDDRNHAPNEKFHIPNFYRGIDTSIWYMAAAARTLRSLNVGKRSLELQAEWAG